VRISPDRDEIRRVTDEVFSGAEFSTEPTLWERFLDWLSTLFDVSAPAADAGSGGSFAAVANLLLYVLVIVLVVGLVAIIVMVIRRWPGRSKRDDGDDFVVEVGEERPTSDWLAMALLAESEERWKDALLCRYRAVIGSLVDDDVIAGVPGATTGELRVQVHDAVPPADEPFDAVTRLLEDAWYRGRATGPDENAEFRAGATKVAAAAAAVAAGEGQPPVRVDSEQVR
jgi:hypothetical protein